MYKLFRNICEYVFKMEDQYLDSELQRNSKLILCISNKTRDNEIDSTLFIGWDNRNHDYFIRGRKLDTEYSNNVPYSFHSENTSDLYSFIKFVFGKRSKYTLTLYNFNNIYDTDNEDKYNYEFFETNMDPNYEIVSYDSELHRRPFFKPLRLLRIMYNWEDFY